MNHAIKIQKAFILHSGTLLPIQNNVLTVWRTKTIKGKRRRNSDNTVSQNKWKALASPTKRQKQVCPPKSTNKKDTARKESN